MSSVYVARQPIFDRHTRLAGYELLFRSGDEQARAVIADHDDATSSVVLNTLTELTLERVVGPHPAWINVTRAFILDGLVDALPAKRTTLEVLEGQEIDDELAAALARLRDRGYKIALDDFTVQGPRAALLPLADIVKLDVMALGVHGAADEMRALRAFDVTTVAEKVESQEEFKLCKEEGFDLYQGYFFCKPEVLRAKAIGTNRLSLLQLLAALQNPDIELKRLEELIGHDVALSYRLLRYINSAFFGLRTRVDGIGRAIALLGLSNVKRWATMTVFAFGFRPAKAAVRRIADVAGNRRVNAGPADFRIQQATRREGDVLYDLSLDSHTRAAGQPAIILVLFVNLRRHFRGLPVGC